MNCILEFTNNLDFSLVGIDIQQIDVCMKV